VESQGHARPDLQEQQDDLKPPQVPADGAFERLQLSQSDCLRCPNSVERQPWHNTR
jgi:hypothetical protein